MVKLFKLLVILCERSQEGKPMDHPPAYNQAVGYSVNQGHMVQGYQPVPTQPQTVIPVAGHPIVNTQPAYNPAYANVRL